MTVYFPGDTVPEGTHVQVRSGYAFTTTREVTIPCFSGADPWVVIDDTGPLTSSGYEAAVDAALVEQTSRRLGDGMRARRPAFRAWVRDEVVARLAMSKRKGGAE